MGPSLLAVKHLTDRHFGRQTQCPVAAIMARHLVDTQMVDMVFILFVGVGQMVFDQKTRRIKL
jgi:hypothetical protein